MRKDVKKVLDENFNLKFLGIKPVMVLKHISVYLEKNESAFFKIYLQHGVSGIRSRKQFNRMIAAETKKYHFPRRFSKFSVKDMENAVQCSKDIDNAIELSIKKEKMKEKLKRLSDDFV